MSKANGASAKGRGGGALSLGDGGGLGTLPAQWPGGRVVAFVCVAAGQGQAVTRATCLVSSTFPRLPSLAQLESEGGSWIKP